MGLLVNGQWSTQWYDTESTGGAFVRKSAAFRHWVTADGTAGISGDAGFKAEKGRYHLYVSLACPWAHRTLLFRQLKGLEEYISLSVVNAFMGDDGWHFMEGSGVIPDDVNHTTYVHELYTKAMADYTGRVTVPILWDKQTSTIVSNESAEIIRMFNSAFDQIGAKAGDYYPQALRSEIDEINEIVFHKINNGVYKAGFATSQIAYDEAVTQLFDALEWLEARLSQQTYLIGDVLTEGDWRTFPTLIRFDAVYVGHFECNRKRIADYRAISRYLEHLYRMPGVAGTVDIDYIKAHYYGSHERINPTRIIPVGPSISLFDES